MYTSIKIQKTLLVGEVAAKIPVELIRSLWSNTKSITRRIVYEFRNSLNQFVDFVSKKKNDLKFYTEFPSGIVSPVFSQLPFNKYMLVEGIKDKRTIKKIRSLNLLIMVHSDSK